MLSFCFSLTRWTLFDWEFIGLDNFSQFMREPALTNGLRNTFVYAVVTSGLKVVIGLLLAILVTSRHPRSKGTAPLDHLLPGAGQHRRRRHHLRGADAPLEGPHQRRRSSSSASTGPRG